MSYFVTHLKQQCVKLQRLEQNRIRTSLCKYFFGIFLVHRTILFDKDLWEAWRYAVYAIFAYLRTAEKKRDFNWYLYVSVVNNHVNVQLGNVVSVSDRYP